MLMLLGQQRDSALHPSIRNPHPPPAMANGSYKGNWESLYMRLLLVLAAVYDSTGSSDVGRRAEGEHAVSSVAIQRFAAFLPFYCHSTPSGSTPPRVGHGGNEAPAPPNFK